jgi:hypothetical protein
MILAVVFVGMSVIGAPAQAIGAKAPEAPKVLGDAGEFGENLYDLAKANDWAKAVEKYQALAAAVKQLAGELKGSAAEKKRLDDAVTALGKSIPATCFYQTVLVMSDATRETWSRAPAE